MRSPRIWPAHVPLSPHDQCISILRWKVPGIPLHSETGQDSWSPYSLSSLALLPRPRPGRAVAPPQQRRRVGQGFPQFPLLLAPSLVLSCWGRWGGSPSRGSSPGAGAVPPCQLPGPGAPPPGIGKGVFCLCPWQSLCGTPTWDQAKDWLPHPPYGGQNCHLKIAPGCSWVCDRPPSRVPRRPVRMQMVSDPPGFTPRSLGCRNPLTTDSAGGPRQWAERQLRGAEGRAWVPVVPHMSRLQETSLATPGTGSPASDCRAQAAPPFPAMGEMTCLWAAPASWAGGQRAETSLCDPGQVTRLPLPPAPDLPAP